MKSNRVSGAAIRRFQDTVLEYYDQQARHTLPWRMAESDGSFDPYKITVSELMLQQTQVQRVIPKFTAFIEQFPSVQSLAAAPLSEVLAAWSGLGYYRRAKFLHQAAQQVVEQYNGIFPDTVAQLQKLPGIGVNTAGAIIVYSFNQPIIFIETNIRTVFIYHFFQSETIVDDTEITQIVQQSLIDVDPRQWYWALMDYGTHLKTTQKNVHRQSRHYKKQSTFQGSKRQIRGNVLKLLRQRPHALSDIQNSIGDERCGEVLLDLQKEHLISEKNNVYSLG